LPIPTFRFVFDGDLRGFSRDIHLFANQLGDRSQRKAAGNMVFEYSY